MDGTVERALGWCLKLSSPLYRVVVKMRTLAALVVCREFMSCRKRRQAIELKGASGFAFVLEIRDDVQLGAAVDAESRHCLQCSSLNPTNKNAN